MTICCSYMLRLLENILPLFSLCYSLLLFSNYAFIAAINFLLLFMVVSSCFSGISAVATTHSWGYFCHHANFMFSLCIEQIWSSFMVIQIIYYVLACLYQQKLNAVIKSKGYSSLQQLRNHNIMNNKHVIFLCVFFSFCSNSLFFFCKVESTGNMSCGSTFFTDGTLKRWKKKQMEKKSDINRSFEIIHWTNT